MPIHIATKDLVEGSLKKLSKATKRKVREAITERGVNAGSVFLAKIIANKTGLPLASASIVANRITKQLVKEIRENLR